MSSSSLSPVVTLLAWQCVVVSSYLSYLYRRSIGCRIKIKVDLYSFVVCFATILTPTRFKPTKQDEDANKQQAAVTTNNSVSQLVCTAKEVVSK